MIDFTVWPPASLDLPRPALDEQLPVLLEALADDVYKGPLRVALEEVRPDLEHGQAERRGAPVRSISLGFSPVAVLKVDDVERLLDDAPDPVQDPVLAV